MVYRNLEDAHAGAGCLHLHLQIPAVRFLTHVEFRERVAADGAEWAHVSVANPVKQSQNESGNASRQDLLEVHAAGFALATRARADHEIMRAARDWVDKLIHERGNVAPVAIKKHNNLAFGRKRANSRSARAPVATGLGYYARAGFARAFGCAISAAVVDDDQVIRQTGRQTFAHDSGDRFLFVKRRDNDRHVAHRKT